MVLLFLGDHGNYVLAVAFLAEEHRLSLIGYNSEACATLFAALASTNTAPASLAGHLFIAYLAQVATVVMRGLPAIHAQNVVGLLEFLLAHDHVLIPGCQILLVVLVAVHGGLQLEDEIVDLFFRDFDGLPFERLPKLFALPKCHDYYISASIKFYILPNQLSSILISFMIYLN